MQTKDSEKWIILRSCKYCKSVLLNQFRLNLCKAHTGKEDKKKEGKSFRLKRSCKITNANSASFTFKTCFTVTWSFNFRRPVIFLASSSWIVLSSNDLVLNTYWRTKKKVKIVLKQIQKVGEDKLLTINSWQFLPSKTSWRKNMFTQSLIPLAVMVQLYPLQSLSFKQNLIPISTQC